MYIRFRSKIKQNYLLHIIGERLRLYLLSTLENRGIYFPLIININMPWSAYISSLSKPAKKNYKFCMKKYYDITIMEIPYSKSIFETFWNIRNLYFSLNDEYKNKILELNSKGYLKFFAGIKNEDIYFLLPVEIYDFYAYLHGPWYHKNKDNYSLGNFIFFSTIKNLIEQFSTQYIDLGYGPLWRYPKNHYKRRFNPESHHYITYSCNICFHSQIICWSKHKPYYISCKNCETEFELSYLNRILIELYFQI